MGNRGLKAARGTFTAAMMDKLSRLPIEEDGRLHDRYYGACIARQYFALHELNALRARGFGEVVTVARVSPADINFELLAHPGRLPQWRWVRVATPGQDDPDACYAIQEKLMAILRHRYAKITPMC